MIEATGMLSSSARREVLGMFQVETRMNFGEELPAGHSEGGWKDGRYIRALVDCNKVCSRLWNMTSR
jgi:hypothetical protein